MSGDPNDMCGECYFCKNAMQHFVQIILVGTTVDGGFAEYVIMHEKQLYTFSDDLEFYRGCNGRTSFLLLAWNRSLSY